MLTIFSIPKPFVGHIGEIQRNAVRSWLALESRPEIVLCGDELGVAETARDLGTRHLGGLDRSSLGTPLLSSAFAAVQKTAQNGVICYVNADIVFCSDPWPILQRIPFDRYLFVGRRWNLDVKGTLDFAAGWREQLRERVQREGVLHTPTGLDYFIFPANCLGPLPKFAVGRPGWDPWMVYRARTLGIPVIDATDVMIAVHQNHDYHHIPQPRNPGTFDGPEGDRNMELAGDGLHFTVHDATHRMTEVGIRSAHAEPYLISRLYRVRTLERSPDVVARIRSKAIYWMAKRRNGVFGGLFRRLITTVAP